MALNGVESQLFQITRSFILGFWLLYYYYFLLFFKIYNIHIQIYISTYLIMEFSKIMRHLFRIICLVGMHFPCNPFLFCPQSASGKESFVDRRLQLKVNFISFWGQVQEEAVATSVSLYFVLIFISILI